MILKTRRPKEALRYEKMNVKQILIIFKKKKKKNFRLLSLSSLDPVDQAFQLRLGLLMMIPLHPDPAF
jgi:hypothetical protein